MPLLLDLTKAARRTFRREVAAVVSIAILSLGIASTTVIFSVLYAVVLKPLPYPESDRLVRIRAADRQAGSSPSDFSYATAQRILENARSFSQMAVFRPETFALTRRGEPRRYDGALTNGRLLSMLGAAVEQGTLFADDLRQGASLVVVSHKVAQRHFGSVSNAIGSSIVLNEKPHTIVGVLKAGFNDYSAGNNPQLWVLISPETDRLMNLDVDLYRVVARLNSTADQATAEVESLLAFPDGKGLAVHLNSLQDEVVGDADSRLYSLFGAVGMLWLIACANTATLLLAEVTSRRREIAIRAALGAGRGRLAKQFLMESLLMSLSAGAFGLLLAYAGLALLSSFIPAELPRSSTVALNEQVLAFGVGLSILTGLVFGVLPALLGSGVRAERVLHGPRRPMGDDRGGHRLRSTLACLQVALSFILLVGAGLAIESFLRLSAEPPGFRPEKILTISVRLPRARYRSGETRLQFYRQVLEGMVQQEAVESAGMASFLPLNRSATEVFTARSRPGGEFQAGFNVLSPGYIESLRIALIEGRTFTWKDIDQETPVALVSESLAKQTWPGQKAIGQQVRLGSADSGAAWLEVVGVIGDVRQSTLAEPPVPHLYVPISQLAPPYATFVLKEQAAPSAVAEAARNVISAVDPNLPLDAAASLERILSDSIAEPRMRAALYSLFAVLATLLAAIGIFAAMHFRVVRQRHALGVRLALGAGRMQLITTVLRGGAAILLAGLVLGLLGGWGLTGLIASQLYKTPTDDSTVYAVTILILLLLGMFATYVPAKRASRTSPLDLLRVQ